jgi:hypothetical protein
MRPDVADALARQQARYGTETRQNNPGAQSPAALQVVKLQGYAQLGYSFELTLHVRSPEEIDRWYEKLINLRIVQPMADADPKGDPAQPDLLLDTPTITDTPAAEPAAGFAEPTGATPADDVAYQPHVTHSSYSNG